MRDDLAHDGGDRVAVSEDAALDLDAVDALLDQHLLVVPARELDCRTELVGAPHLRDPHRRAEAGGLHEYGVVEIVRGYVAVPKRHVARDRDPAVAEHRLEEVLVHAQSRRGDAGADVRHSRQLEEPLHGAVLPERPVQDGQDDVDLAECCCRRGVGDDGKRLDARLWQLAASA